MLQGPHTGATHRHHTQAGLRSKLAQSFHLDYRMFTFFKLVIKCEIRIFRIKSHIFNFFFIKNFQVDSRVWGREGEREGENLPCERETLIIASHRHPDRESNPQSLIGGTTPN